MRNLRNFVILAVMLMALVNCQREKVSSNSTSVGSNTTYNDRAVLHEIDSSAYFNEAYNTLTPVTEGVRVDNGMLVFESLEAFEKVMGSLVNQPEEKLDAWERELGFTSLRSYYNNLMQDENVDDYELDMNRIPDEYFETVLNKEGKIRIGDSIYVIDYINAVNTINYENARGDTINCYAWTDYQTYCSRVINGGKNKIRGTKWVHNFGLYNSLGIRTNYYKKNWRGKWKKKKASEINFLIDQWHYLKYWVVRGTASNINCYNPIVYTSYGGRKTNARRIENIIQYTIFDKIKVKEFGRVHHWTTNYNEACHTEAW